MSTGNGTGLGNGPIAPGFRDETTNRPEVRSVDAHDRRIRTILTRIEEQPTQSITELAQGVGLSVGRLKRLFRQNTGAYLSAHLADCKLRMAARLLSSSSLSIKEIASAIGYEHHSSFTRAFERRFGQSPKQLRQQSYFEEC
jgi:AraC-like DNA-binding protein